MWPRFPDSARSLDSGQWVVLVGWIVDTAVQHAALPKNEALSSIDVPSRAVRVAVQGDSHSVSDSTVVRASHGHGVTVL